MFPIVVLEGPIVTIIAGFLASKNYMDFWISYFISIIANIFADTIYYYIGKYSKNKFTRKLARKIGINESKSIRIQENIKKNVGKTLIIGKLAYVVTIPIIVACGTIKVPILKFIFYSTIGTSLISFIMILIGFYLGNALNEINSILNFISAIIILTIFIFIMHIARKKIKNKTI